MTRSKDAKTFTDAERGTIIALHAERYRYSTIASRLNRDASAVRRFLLKCKNEDGTFEIKKRLKHEAGRENQERSMTDELLSRLKGTDFSLRRRSRRASLQSYRSV
jgi:IS30 family transposase